MKQVYTYFWKTLLIGDLILLTLISLAFFQKLTNRTKLLKSPKNPKCVCHSVEAGEGLSGKVRRPRGISSLPVPHRFRKVHKLFQFGGNCLHCNGCCLLASVHSCKLLCAFVLFFQVDNSNLFPREAIPVHLESVLPNVFLSKLTKTPVTSRASTFP